MMLCQLSNFWTDDGAKLDTDSVHSSKVYASFSPRLSAAVFLAVLFELIGSLCCEFVVASSSPVLGTAASS